MKINVRYKPNEDIYSVLKEIEIPIIPVIVKMELRGIHVDLEYANKISKIFHEKSDAIQREVDEELLKLKPLIDEWKLTPDANSSKRVYPAKRTKIKEEDIPLKFPLIDEKGNHYKLSGKSPAQQLSDPIEVTSTTQLQILLYDILKVDVVDKKDPRGTGTDILKELAKKVDICKVMLKKRENDILINTFIDKIPEYVKEDGTLHAKFNSMGTVTGRFSSTNPNLQQIPAHEKSIRMMFVPSIKYNTVNCDSSMYTVDGCDDIQLEDDSWINVKSLKVGDLIKTNEGIDEVLDIKQKDRMYFIFV